MARTQKNLRHFSDATSASDAIDATYSASTSDAIDSAPDSSRTKQFLISADPVQISSSPHPATTSPPTKDDDWCFIFVCKSKLFKYLFYHNKFLIMNFTYLNYYNKILCDILRFLIISMIKFSRSIKSTFCYFSKNSFLLNLEFLKLLFKKLVILINPKIVIFKKHVILINPKIVIFVN